MEVLTEADVVGFANLAAVSTVCFRRRRANGCEKGLLALDPTNPQNGRSHG